MSFDFDEINELEGDTNWWTACSDLFMMLSSVFLLLFVVANMRSGSYSLKTNIEHQKLTQQVQDLKQQIEVYNTLKEDYLTKGASTEEKETYTELMDKLNLLQDDAKNEKNQLRQKALENEKKEAALNKYQQLIRNIINSNLLAQTRIKKRESIIQQQEQTLAQRRNEIKDLEKTIVERQNTVQKGEKEIARIKSKLDQKIEQLNMAFEDNRISKEKLNEKIESLKQQSEEEINKLANVNKNISDQLNQANQQLVQSKDALLQVNTKLLEGQDEKAKLISKLEGIAGTHRAEIEGLQRGFSERMGKEKAAFEAALNNEKLSAAGRAAKEAEYRARVQRQADELKGKIADLTGKINVSENELRDAKEKMNARKKIANRISQNFKNAGVDSEVDPNTGDVTLSFGEYYFETDKYDLKAGMRQKLDQMIPIYAKSLFEDKEVGEMIASVEIVGFASPTYQGKFVDPKSVDDKDRIAVNYNLDLSYQRGKSVFNYIFNPELLKYKYQKKLWPLVKVTGRSFLAEEVMGRDISSAISRIDFCKKYNCNKSQKVIIKFNLKD